MIARGLPIRFPVPDVVIGGNWGIYFAKYTAQNVVGF